MTSGLTWVGALVVASMAMVVAMVQFTKALISSRPSSNARLSWALVYGCTWLAVLYSIGRIPRTDVAPEPELFWIGVFAVAGWVAFNAFWIVSWSAIVRANASSGTVTGMPPDIEVLTRRARTIAQLGAVAAFGALLEMGAPQQIVRSAVAPGRRAATLTMTIAGAGFVLFMTGAIRLALYGGGEATVTLDECRQAWRTGTWRRNGPWITLFMMMSGGLLALVGGLSAGFVMGGEATRLVLGFFVVYGVFVGWRGRRKSRRRGGT